MTTGVGGDESLESELSWFVCVKVLHAPTSTKLCRIFFITGLWQMTTGVGEDESLESESSWFVGLELLYVATSTPLSSIFFQFYDK